MQQLKEQTPFTLLQTMKNLDIHLTKYVQGMYIKITKWR